MLRCDLKHAQIVRRDSLMRVVRTRAQVGCCGADGPSDYLLLHQPLPSECRDSVTGNAFFYGCVDELTWFFEEKSGWVCGLVMTLCAIQVINIVLCTVLIHALKTEEDLDHEQYVYKPTTTRSL
ncbi:Tetraspanin-2A [Gryllus bimaculatus]|nr:Tetraspanin-2A [Gryllus bimaculatus]